MLIFQGVYFKDFWGDWLILMMQELEAAPGVAKTMIGEASMNDFFFKENTGRLHDRLGGETSNMFDFCSYLGKISNLTYIF